jgi:hypothetical protein
VLVNADADDRAMPVFSSAQTARQAEATYEAIKSVDLIYACGGITDAARLDRLGAVALQKWPHLGSERGILLAMRGPKPALSAGAVSFRCTRSTSRNERIHCAGRLRPGGISYLSLSASEAVSTSGEKTYSRIRWLPVAISTVTVMPGLSSVRSPSIIM